MSDILLKTPEKFIDYYLDKTLVFYRIHYTIAARGIVSTLIKVLTELRNQSGIPIEYIHVPLGTQVGKGFWLAKILQYKALMTKEQRSVFFQGWKKSPKFDEGFRRVVKPRIQGFKSFNLAEDNLTRYVPLDKEQPVWEHLFYGRAVAGKNAGVYHVSLNSFMQYVFKPLDIQIKNLSGKTVGIDIGEYSVSASVSDESAIGFTELLYCLYTEQVLNGVIDNPEPIYQEFEKRDLSFGKNIERSIIAEVNDRILGSVPKRF